MDILQIIPPSVVTGVARLQQAAEDWRVNEFQFGQWFPNVEVDGIDFEASGGTDRTYSESAHFRAFDTAPRLGTRPGITTVSGELPAISIEYEMGEFQKIKNRAAARNAQLAELIEPVVTKDIIRGVAAVERRMEFYRRDLLVNGRTTIADDGLRLDVDVERNPARMSNAAVGWTDTLNARPFNDEYGNLRVLEDEENLVATDFVAMMNSVTYRAWKDTDQVKKAIRDVRVREIITNTEANEIRASLDLPPIQLNNSRGQNPNTGIVEKLVPDNVVIYLPRFGIGSTQYGVSAMADEADVDIAQDQRPGLLAYLTRNLKPLVTSTVIDGIGAPVLVDPDATYAFTTEP